MQANGCLNLNPSKRLESAGRRGHQAGAKRESIGLLKGKLSLLPKDVSLETQTEQIAYGGLPETRALLERIIRESEAQHAALIKNSPDTMV